jgi:hypothetical protein
MGQYSADCNGGAPSPVNAGSPVPAHVQIVPVPAQATDGDAGFSTPHEATRAKDNHPLDLIPIDVIFLIWSPWQRLPPC